MAGACRPNRVGRAGGLVDRMAWVGRAGGPDDMVGRVIGAVRLIW